MKPFSYKLILFLSHYWTDSIPAELKDPFYTDQYEQEHLKPPVTSLLLSADLYCRAGSLILKSDAAKPLLGHDAVIQALAQRGLYVTDQDRLVIERDLRKRPLQMVRYFAYWFFFCRHQDLDSKSDALCGGILTSFLTATQACFVHKSFFSVHMSYKHYTKERQKLDKQAF